MVIRLTQKLGEVFFSILISLDQHNRELGKYEKEFARLVEQDGFGQLVKRICFDDYEKKANGCTILIKGEYMSDGQKVPSNEKFALNYDERLFLQTMMNDFSQEHSKRKSVRYTINRLSRQKMPLKKVLQCFLQEKKN